MKKYISSGSWFSFEYPNAWHEFEDQEGSFLFYNPSTWTGNLRVSASLDTSADFARNVMRDELAQYADAQLVEIGGKEFVYSRETFQEGEAWYTTHFWVTGYRNMAVFVTFTTSKGGDTCEAKAVLETLTLMNPHEPACDECIEVRLVEIAIINDAYEKVQKEVKNGLKKDFSNVDSVTGIALLQRMIDEKKWKPNRVIWERIAYVLGCFFIEEVENVSWCTRVKGKDEHPELIFCQEGERSRTIDPVKYLIENHVGTQGECDLMKAYEGILSGMA